MIIWIKTWTGKCLKIQVEKSDSVFKLKQKIQDKEGIPPGHQRIIYSAKQLDGPILVIPTLKKECQSKDYLFGHGNKEIKALFVNGEKTFVKFRYSKFTDIGMILREFLEYMKNDLHSKIAIEEYCVKLLCGDQIVFSIGGEFLSDFVNFGGKEFRNNRRNRFEYFYPRNEIWSIIIDGYHGGRSLGDIGVRNDSTISLVLRLRGASHRYSRRIIQADPDGICDGINIVGRCTNDKCDDYTEKKITIPYSRNVFFGGNIEKIIYSVNSVPSKYGIQMYKITRVLRLCESFDFDFDLKKIEKEKAVCKCPKCKVIIEPVKVILKNCYWKYSSIISGLKNKGGGELKRKDSSWEFCGDDIRNNIMFDYKEFMKKYENCVHRLQIQARFNTEYNREAVLNNYGEYPLTHPDRIRCIFCSEKQFKRGRAIDSILNIQGFNREDFKKMSNCDHYVHLSCLKKWKDYFPVEIKCIQCQSQMINGSSSLEVIDIYKTERIQFVVNEMILASNDHDHCLGIDIHQKNNVFFIPKFFFFLTVWW